MTQLELEFANHYLQLRGPDHTSHVQRNGVHFVHNLLWLTGKLTPQPFVDEQSGVVALFNGEIYNYRELGWDGLTTDGEALLPMYRTYGEHFPQRLRGEFAVVVADEKRDLLVLSTDVFGTKPFWSASDHNGRFGVASYASALLRLGFRPRLMAELEPNTIEVRQLSSFRLLRAHRLHTFDLCCQHKHNLDDWTRAFHRSMERRAATLQHGCFVGLSGGVDSGCIALRLVEMKVAHHIFSLSASEEVRIVQARHAWASREAAGLATPHPVEQLSRESYAAQFAWFPQHVEAYAYTQPHRRIGLMNDAGAVGLSHICAQAKLLGVRVYLSGAGADEVHGDYGRVKQWPANLSQVWPWPAFFGHEMRDYLRKEEHVAGAHGIEGRFPYLDVDVVQEYLWLNTTLKATRQGPDQAKLPLHDYLARAGYPAVKKKRGFWGASWQAWNANLTRQAKRADEASRLEKRAARAAGAVGAPGEAPILRARPASTGCTHAGP